MEALTKSFLPKQAFNTFKEAKISYNEHGSFSNEVLEILYSYFGESLIQATELLEKCKITCYSTPDSFRKVYEISTTREQFTMFENINFCHCNFFKNRVLDARCSLSCKHVLAVYLGIIMGKIREESLAENIFGEYLDTQLNAFLDVDTQEIL